MHTKDIAYSDGSANLLGFLAYGEKAEGERPGILVAHEGLGLEHPDMFGDRHQAHTVDESRGLIGPLRSDRQMLLRFLPSKFALSRRRCAPPTSATGRC